MNRHLNSTCSQMMARKFCGSVSVTWQVMSFHMEEILPGKRRGVQPCGVCAVSGTGPREMRTEHWTLLSLSLPLQWGLQHQPHWVASRNKEISPGLVRLSGLSTDLWTKGSLVQFPVRAHAWVMGQVPSRGHMRSKHALMFPSLSPLPSPLSEKLIN